MQDTCRLYTDLAWLWPMWGGATTEYAGDCRHVTGLIRQHAKHPATTLLDIGCGGGKNVLNLKHEFNVTGVDLSNTMRHVLRETGFEVHEGRYNPGEDEYTVFTCVKTG